MGGRKEYRKEYHIDNREKLLDKSKDYHESHKDKIHARKNVHYDCPCGGKYPYCSKSRHFKTKKHIKYIEQQNKED